MARRQKKRLLGPQRGRGVKHSICLHENDHGHGGPEGTTPDRCGLPPLLSSPPSPPLLPPLLFPLQSCELLVALQILLAALASDPERVRARVPRLGTHLMSPTMMMTTITTTTARPSVSIDFDGGDAASNSYSAGLQDISPHALIVFPILVLRPREFGQPDSQTTPWLQYSLTWVNAQR